MDKMNYNPEKDGIDHINIYSQTNSKVGKMLSNFYKCDVYTDHGRFNSIEGYWYWLSCRDDKLRDMWGYKAKKYGREQGADDWLDEEEFSSTIKKAITDKVIRNKTILKEMLKSELPFVHYYNFGGNIVVPDKGLWIIDYITYLRTFLRDYYMWRKNK